MSQGNGGKKQEEPPRTKSTKSRNAKSSKSKLTTFELYGKFFNERRIVEEQKVIRPIRDGRLRLNNTRLQRYKKFQGKRFLSMANVGTNSSTRNILYQIPTPPQPPEYLRDNVQEQLPQTDKARQKKAEAVLPARLDFVHVFEPWAFRENEMPKYSVTLIISKNDTDTIRKVHEAVRQAYENGKSELQGIELKDMRFPLRDGDAERPDNPAYKNCWFINATNNGKFRVPAVCDIHGKPIADRNQLYSGVWGKVHVSFAAYGKGDNTSMKGIGCYLNAVQKTKDDERIWGVADPFAVFN